MDSSTLLCLFSGRVEERDGEYVVTIPQQEVDLGALESEETYRVGVYPGVSTPSGAADRPDSTIADDDSGDARFARRKEASHPTRDSTTSTSSSTASPSASTDSTPDQPPVTEGEKRRLQIEDVGDQGDGLARVGPGYVVFVPDTEIGQQPLVRITTVRENVAFAEVLEQ
ncbi:deoxyribonuclease [Haloglomus irregulare]|uniref:Deoxyribonuclease n=1 Tax=Haloglomus irregulare TaxID=2234134 RepID=A0A554MUR8_9EURY|nr:TRAM domain-containing protein [Haloglomus irregulare]TSD08873.1 deoxyribonuclease [Haloglomus irregulare]